jgi:hypothetical protein
MSHSNGRHISIMLCTITETAQKKCILKGNNYLTFEK